MTQAAIAADIGTAREVVFRALSARSCVTTGRARIDILNLAALRAGRPLHIAVGAIRVVVALAACYFPSARAARVDPLVALRHE